MFGRRLSTFSVWRYATVALLVGGMVSLDTMPSAAASDKILSHQRGTVQYTLGGSTKTIYTRLPVPDDATAITGPKSLATLTMPDSSEIDIGERTTVQIGQFNDINSAKDNTISLKNGALHFVIRHPEGTKANYEFVTPTSQIAIRGTEGFLISNAGGTQVTIVSGTAQVTAISTGVTIAVPAGTTGVVSASGAATVSTTTSTLSVSSISGTTSATSATTGVAAGGAASGAAASTTAAIAGGAAAATAGVVAATSGKSGNSSSSTGSPGPFIIGGSTVPATAVDVYAQFPHAFSSQEITQANCTSDATVTATGPVTLTTTTLPCTGGSLSGSISGQFTGVGSAVFTISGSGETATHTENIYGKITATISGGTASATISGQDSSFAVGAINVTTLPQTIPVSISQSGPSPVTFTSTLNCSNVSSATNANSFIGIGSVGTFSSSAANYSLDVSAAPAYAAGTAPSSAPPYACLLTIQGISNDGTTGTGFDTSASEVQLANLGHLGERRHPVRSPAHRNLTRSAPYPDEGLSGPRVSAAADSRSRRPGSRSGAPP